MLIVECWPRIVEVYNVVIFASSIIRLLIIDPCSLDSYILIFSLVELIYKYCLKSGV
jgi:hypothetical protein